MMSDDDSALLDAGHVRHHCRLHVNCVANALPTVAIVTQCSFDRRAALERLVKAWDGVVVCALLLEDRRAAAIAEPMSDMIAALTTAHTALRQHLLLDVYRRSAVDAAKPYPINRLRNAALSAATTLGVPLVLILDVDCVPSEGALAALVGDPSRAAALHRLCFDDGDALCIPCVEMLSAESAPVSLAAVKAAVRDSRAQPFMAERWICGHRATDFARWAASSAAAPAFIGPLRFEEFFEPYVVVALSMCPRFDEGLSGYGRNKALHALQLHRCGARFWASAATCVVHWPHAPSQDFDAALGTPSEGGDVGSRRSREMGKQHLMAAKRRYETVARALVSHCYATLPLLPSPGEGRLSRQVMAGRCCRWADGTPPEAIAAARAMLRHRVGDSPNSDDSDHARLVQLCSRWLEYTAPSATSTPLAPIGTPCTTDDEAAWLVTHLSADRLDRLGALVASWPGCIVAAVWVGRDRRATAAVRAFAEALRAHRVRQCRLILVRGPPPTWNLGRPFASALSCRAPPSTYPVNLMRRIALDHTPDAALALLTDVDARPPLALGLALASGDAKRQEQQHEQLSLAVLPPSSWQPAPSQPSQPSPTSPPPLSWCMAVRTLVHETCRNRGRFLVLPALEFVPELLASTISEAAADLMEPTSAPTAQAALSRHAELLRSFHSMSCPDGHAPSGAAKWLSDVLRHSPTAIAAVDVDYAPGYEPYGFVEVRRLKAMGCGPDERFIGWHRDRVEWFLRLASRRAVAGFSVLRSPVGFVLDWQPHAPTAQRVTSRDDPLYVAAMEGLYRRAQRTLWAGAEPHTYQPAATEAVEASAAAVELCDATRGQLVAGAEHVTSDGEALAMLCKREGDAVAEWQRAFGCSAGQEAGKDGGKKADRETSEARVDEATADGMSAESAQMLSVWDADAQWRVHGGHASLANVTRQDTGRASTARVRLHAGIGPPSHACKRGLDPSGVAIKMGPTSLDAAAAGLAVAFDVCFEEAFQWGNGGGVLPGVYCEPAGPSGIGLDARFRWGASGGLRFRADLVSPTRRWPLRLAIHVDRRSHQLLRGTWHRLSVAVCPRDGSIGAWADGVCIHRSGGPTSVCFGGGAAGLRMCVFRSCPCEETNQATVTLRGLQLHCATGTKACVLAAARVSDAADASDADVDALIATEVTVVFAPKEWQSTGPATLQELVATAPRPRRLVVAIVPPLSDATAAQLRAVASGAWRGTSTDVLVVDEPRSFRNAYELRNEVAAIHASDTKYVLHLNNDVVECAAPSMPRHHWLRELVRSAEREPNIWAMQPILIERTPHAPLHLHAWWTSVTRSSSVPAIAAKEADSTTSSPSPTPRAVLHARFDSSTCSLPLAALPEHLLGHPPAFLEDHCILARTAHFTSSTPLFDPQSCFRREFFDLAWSIRRRGGDVGLAVASVVIYDRLAYTLPSSALEALPTVPDGARIVVPHDDLFGFVARRHDEISHSSVRHLDAKWACTYAGDKWHEVQRDQTLDGLQLSAADDAVLLNDPTQRARLLLCAPLLLGFDRFQWQVLDERMVVSTDGDDRSAPLNALDALREMPEAAADRACCVVRFWRASDGALDAAADVAPGGSTNDSASLQADPLDGLVPWLPVGAAPSSPVTAQNDDSCQRGNEHELIRVSELSPWSMSRLRPMAMMAGSDTVWLWLRWPRVMDGCKTDSIRARALQAARRLARSMGGPGAETATKAVSSLDLRSRIDHWSYRPLTLEELEAEIQQDVLLQQQLPAQLSDAAIFGGVIIERDMNLGAAPRSRWRWSVRMVRAFFGRLRS